VRVKVDGQAVVGRRQELRDKRIRRDIGRHPAVFQRLDSKTAPGGGSFCFGPRGGGKTTQPCLPRNMLHRCFQLEITRRISSGAKNQYTRHDLRRSKENTAKSLREREDLTKANPCRFVILRR